MASVGKDWDPHRGTEVSVHARPLRSLLLGPLVLALGCTAALDPERIDGLARCEWDRDCPDSGDARWAQSCVETEGSGGKVCAPVFTPLSCDPYDYDPRSTFRLQFEAAKAIEGRYEYDCQDPAGVMGCIPSKGQCADGLVVDPKSGRCDDSDPSTPPALAPETFVAGQDVRDQFCRSFFCDETFVCNTRTDGKEDVCVPCELGKPLAQGGCGELYIDGEKSGVYQSQAELERDCQAPDVDPEATIFGEPM